MGIRERNTTETVGGWKEWLFVAKNEGQAKNP